MLREVSNLPFCASDYPITVAEVSAACETLDRLLINSEREELINGLAYQPDNGENVNGCPGYRSRVFEFEDGVQFRSVTVVYFFHDLNMPLYVVAAYEGEVEIRPQSWEEETMNSLAAQLVQACHKGADRALGKA